MFRTKSSATLAVGFGTLRLPYLYSDPMEQSCRLIADKGFDAVELLVTDAKIVTQQDIRRCLADYRLELSAIGTGGAYRTDGLHLCSPDRSVREAAERYVMAIVDLAAPFDALVILGSIMGAVEPGVDRATVLGWLEPALGRLGKYASDRNTRLVIEPVNRYESNLINRLEDGIDLLSRVDTDGIGLLADLFHMNIEEPSIEKSIVQAGSAIWHVHFVDSNRSAPGMGHLNLQEVAGALSDIGYSGYISIEAFPEPDFDTAATRAIGAYQQWFATHAD